VLFLNLALRHEGVLWEWRYSSTHSLTPYARWRLKLPTVTRTKPGFTNIIASFILNQLFNLSLQVVTVLGAWQGLGTTVIKFVVLKADKIWVEVLWVMTQHTDVVLTANQENIALSLEVKRPGREADHSLPSSAEVKNAWSYTSTPPIRLNGLLLS
jgi:hypothetical protein